MLRCFKMADWIKSRDFLLIFLYGIFRLQNITSAWSDTTQIIEMYRESP